MRKDICLGFTERIEKAASILWERVLMVMAINSFPEKMTNEVKRGVWALLSVTKNNCCIMCDILSL